MKAKKNTLKGIKLTTFVSCVLGLLAHGITTAQKVDYPVNNMVVVKYPDHVVYAHFGNPEKALKTDDTKFYYWYNTNDIKHTRGGYDGKILHGVYTEYYLNKDLKEKGQFKEGLKHGEWKSWYSNGELKEKCTYKKGDKRSYEWYAFDGRTKEKGTLMNGKLEKKRTVYDTSGVILKTEYYKKGILQKNKEKKEHKSKKKRITKKGQRKINTMQPGQGSGVYDSLNVLQPVGADTIHYSEEELKKRIADKKKSEKTKKKKKKKGSGKDVIRIRRSQKIVPADPENPSI